MAETLLLAVGGTVLAAAAGGAVAVRLGQSVIPFYVVAGVLAGPHVLGAAGLPHLATSEVVELAADLGVVFLLFFLGLEFSFDRLVAQWERLGAAGVADLAINFPVGLALGLALGWTVVEALFLAGVVYISSSAVITKSLVDLGWIADEESTPILGTLVFEDLAIAVYLAVMPALVVGGGGLGAVAVDAGTALAFLVGLLAVVRLGAGAFGRLAALNSEELRVLATVGVTVFVAGAALAVGASEAVAAFFVGMGVGETDRAADVERLLVPLRDLFAAVFFVWIGLTTDLAAMATVLGLLAAAVALTTPTKVASGYLAGRLYDLDGRRSFRVGAAMVTRGEFSLVIAALAARGSGPVLSEVVPAFAVGYVLVMSLLGTATMQYADRLWAAVGSVASQVAAGADRPAD